MTASNIWALIIGGVAAGGVLTGAVVWQRNHPGEAPTHEIATLTTPPSLNPPKEAAPAVAPKPAAKAAKAIEGASLTTGAPPNAEPASGHGEPPHFDVVRVEPSGEAVLAGKGDPNAKVALLSSGKIVAETKADSSGQFVIVPPTLAPGDHDLSLRQTTQGKTDQDSKQNVAVSVPTNSKGSVVVALAEPGKPTKVLSGHSAKPAPGVATAPATPQPPAAAAAKNGAQVAVAEPETAVAPPAAIKAAGPDLAIRSVELENGNGFYVTGIAPAGTHVQIYLNNSHLAEVVAGADQQWSLKVKKGLTGGHYIVRADASRQGRQVTARAEVPFDVPVAMAAKPAEPPVVADVKPSEAPPAEPTKPAVTAAKPAAAPIAVAKPNAPPPKVAAQVPPEAPPAKPAAAPPPAQVTEAAPPSTPVKPPATATKPPAAAPEIRPPVAAAPEPKPAASPSVTASAPATATAAPDPAHAVIEQVETATVVQGDNLWNISRVRLGAGERYTRIYTANSDQIRNPNLIYPGQVFVVPPNEAAN